MTSLALRHPNAGKNTLESNPAKRSLSRKETKRKKTSQNTHRQLVPGTNLLSKRPNTSHMLLRAAEKMHGQNKPTGRNKITLIAPVHVFAFKYLKEKFLHLEKDYRMTAIKFY